MTDYNCGVPKDEIALTDEQVSSINSHEPVQTARTAFLTKLKEAMAGSFSMEEAKLLEAEYLRLFEERLKFVVENPPEPKPIAVKEFRGFGRRP